MFINTLTIDDPAVADEASLPTFSWQANANGGAGQNDYFAAVALDKHITEHFGLALNHGVTALTTQGANTHSGTQSLEITAKYQVYINEQHEFIVSLGVIQEVGGTGTHVTTMPTVHFGKGFGDLPIGLLAQFHPYFDDLFPNSLGKPLVSW